MVSERDTSTQRELPKIGQDALRILKRITDQIRHAKYAHDAET